MRVHLHDAASALFVLTLLTLVVGTAALCAFAAWSAYVQRRRSAPATLD